MDTINHQHLNMRMMTSYRQMSLAVCQPPRFTIDVQVMAHMGLLSLSLLLIILFSYLPKDGLRLGM